VPTTHTIETLQLPQGVPTARHRESPHANVSPARTPVAAYFTVCNKAQRTPTQALLNHDKEFKYLFCETVHTFY